MPCSKCCTSIGDYFSNYFRKLAGKPSVKNVHVGKASIPLMTMGASSSSSAAAAAGGESTAARPERCKCCSRQEAIELFLFALASFVVSFVSMLAIAYLQYHVFEQYYKDHAKVPLELLAYAFGATAVLLYDAYDSPQSQPRNVLGGHLISAVIGVTVRLLLFDRLPFVALPLSISLAIVAMRLTGTVHAPAGATALIATTASSLSKDVMAFVYILLPLSAGIIIMIILAWLLNNLIIPRFYPRYWW